MNPENGHSNGNTVSYEILFGRCESSTISRDSWGMDNQVSVEHKEVTKRRISMSLGGKKKAKMTRGDENIADEVAKQAAKEVLDEILNAPGQISLDFDSPQASELYPLPLDLDQTTLSQWSIDQLQEGRLSNLLKENKTRFKAIGIQKLQKGEVEQEVLPRQMDMKEIISNLKNEANNNNQYVGFAVAVASVLRRCNDETAQKITQTITETIEKEASIVINKQ